MLWFFFFPHWKLVFLSFSANANFGSMSLPKVVWSSLEKGRGWDGLWSPAWGSHSWCCYRGLSILEWGKPCGHCFQAVTFPPTRPTHQKYPAAVDIQLLSRVWLFVTPWTTARQTSFTISQSLLKLMSIELMISSNYVILCCPLLLLPPIFLSIRLKIEYFTLKNHAIIW